MTPYYDSDGVTIYHGDCRAILPTIGRAAHVLTDPPYDEQTHDGARTNKRDRPSDALGVIDIAFDPLADVQATARLLLSAADRWVVAFCAMEMLGDYKRGAGDAWVRSGFWHRTDGMPQVTGDRPGQPGEGIAIMHRALSAGRVGRTRWNRGGHHAFWAAQVVRGKNRVHDTQKPEALMIQLVCDFTDPNDVVLDPFMGSGTTLVACKRLGRRAIGIDLDESCCEHAARRLEQGVLDLFGSEPEKDDAEPFTLTS